MRDLVFKWVVGNEVGSLSLTQPMGSSGSIQVMLNNWYLGQVVRYGGDWFFYLNRNSDLGNFEILTLKEALDNEEKTFSSGVFPAAIAPG
jgi:hypothetical protein